MNEKLTRYQNDVIELSDNLLAYSQELQNQLGDNVITPFEVFYTLADKLDSSEQHDHLVQKISDDLIELPIFYHAQVLKTFLRRLYRKELQISYLPKETHEALAFSDDLLMSTREFIKVTKRTPSPLEVIYLYLGKMFSVTNDHVDKQSHVALARKVGANNELAGRGLSDYLTQFQAQYGKQLKQGVLTDVD